MSDIPEFGSILQKYTKTANSVETTRTAMYLALTEFWQKFVVNFSLPAKFFFEGTQTVGVVVTPVVGKVGSLSATTIPMIPTTAMIGTFLSNAEPWVGLGQVFSYTINNTVWMIDCKAQSFATPMIAQPVKTDFSAIALSCKEGMFAKKPTTHDVAMQLLSNYIQTMIHTVFAAVPYTGTGVGVLTGVLELYFE